MAERIVSPGVFITENNLDYLPPALNEAGGVIIGPFLKGPAFYPTVLTSRNEAIQKFGDTYDKFYTPYAVQEYLRNAGSVQVVRVLWEEGYQADNIEITSTESGSLCILAPTSDSDTDLTITWPETSVTSSDMKFTLSSSAGEVDYTASLHSADSNYIKDLFGTSPWGDKGVYVHSIFDTVIGTTVMYDITGSRNINGIDFDGQVYSEATTPWILSQVPTGGTATNLFKFHSLSHGDYTNGEIKIGIFDVKPASEIAGSDFGTFGVVIRELSDTDNSPKVLETFTECTIDPNSTNYIARKIGDRYGTYTSVGGETKLRMNGDYEPQSDYVRVEMDATVDRGGVAKNLVPFGFAAPYVPFSSSIAPPAMHYITTSLENGAVNTKIYKGVDLHSTYEEDNKQFLKAIPDNYLTGSNIAFHLEDTTSGSVSCSLSSTLSYKQFTIPMQGGFDGKSPANRLTTDSTTLMGFDTTSSTTSGSVSYKKAFDTVSNKDEIVMNLLVAPGVNLVEQSSLYTYAKNICEDRGDTFFIVDCGSSTQTVANAVSQTTTLDSSYAATYYPWVKIKDTNTNRYVWVPPSVVIPGVIAFNDKVGYEWYAPAGLNRGGLTSVIEAKTRLTHLERDDLYTARINPIASFPNIGTVVWGQKTLQALASATDRINVRRLLIKLKEYVNYVSKQLNFQNNTNSERQKWVNTITPYMESVQAKNGLYAFKVVMDDTNNTPDDIDRNIMRGEIWIKPSRVAEFIIIDFNITRTGATFGA